MSRNGSPNGTCAFHCQTRGWLSNGYHNPEYMLRTVMQRGSETVGYDT